MKLPVRQGVLRSVKLAVRLGLPIPLCFMPLSSNLDLVRGVGTATFTRSTTGTYIDRTDGLLKTAAIDEPRFETDGLLIEGSSTNLLLRSEEFDDSTWSKTNVTVTPNNAVSPDGTQTADLIIPSASSNQKFFLQNSSIVSGTTYTQTVYAQSAGYDFIQITGSVGFPSTVWVNFNLSTGQIGNSNLPAGSASIQDLGDGIYRCSLTLEADTTTSGRMVYGPLATDVASRLPAYTGDGTSGINVWGAQLEELPFATSYIPTTTTTVTRTADNLSIDAANISDPANDYSVSVEVSLLGINSTGNQFIFSVISETFRFSRARDALSSGQYSMLSSGSSGDRVSGGVFPLGVQKATAVSDGSSSLLYLNGSLVGSDSSSSAITGSATSITIGESLYGHMKNFRTYDVALTAEQVSQL